MIQYCVKCGAPIGDSTAVHICPAMKPVIVRTGHDITLARKLRLAVVANCFKAGQLMYDDAIELLKLPVIPGDETTRYDDSQLLYDSNGTHHIYD